MKPVSASSSKRCPPCGTRTGLGQRSAGCPRENHGWDILSCTPDHEVRFLEVKGRVAGATTVTVTRNEMLAALNQPRRWFLVVVFVDGE